MRKPVVIRGFGALLIAALCLVSGACKAKMPARAPVPPPVIIHVPTMLEIGEASFEAGKYDEAAVYLESYLKDESNTIDRDRAHFKLGLIYALASRIPQDFRRAQNQFHILEKDYPDSPYLPKNPLLFDLLDEIQAQASDVSKKDEAIQQKDATLAEQEDRIMKQGASIKDKDGRLREREARIKEKDERIKERDETIRRLTDELERMKKIDLQRHPSRPPN